MPDDYEGYDDEVVCPNCKRRVVQGKVARDDHDDCEPDQSDTARRREAIRRLHRDTARMLRRLGYDEDAAYHDLEGNR